MVKKKDSSKKDTPSTRKRVSFSISSDPDTIEGRIIDYLRDNKLVNMRESVIRALKAYYLPWAYEDTVSKEEAQVLARNAIDELEFRIFQIRRHFLAGEPYGPKLSESLGGSSATNGHGATGTNGHGGNGHSSLSQSMMFEKIIPPKPVDTNPTSLSDMLEDEDIDPDVLDDF
ncbi:hypothetical protein N836_09320 [Leptolyngbya sp. Heron Island J]|uniref:hypothetical protein n=1 Tax=Leptolyngbya sp. Heron Island J TaxID=1385935 RepID=UPI0003B9409B|nr:hypothetical protein [Leptolyngbya sp. Heron Island J]ESA36011.1 hypothetical protein N836_09320 [Leptolyngbya sp. Heron Island J]